MKFEKKPRAKDGDTLHLTLEDGRMLDCQVLDASPILRGRRRRSVLRQTHGAP